MCSSQPSCNNIFPSSTPKVPNGSSGCPYTVDPRSLPQNDRNSHNSNIGVWGRSLLHRASISRWRPVHRAERRDRHRLEPLTLVRDVSAQYIIRILAISVILAGDDQPHGPYAPRSRRRAERECEHGRQGQRAPRAAGDMDAVCSSSVAPGSRGRMRCAPPPAGPARPRRPSALPGLPCLRDANRCPGAAVQTSAALCR
jgi:hypothetical protein